MSPLLVFSVCIAAAVVVGYLRSLELAAPITLRSATPTLSTPATPSTRLAPKRPVALPVEDLEHPEAA